VAWIVTDVDIEHDTTPPTSTWSTDPITIDVGEVLTVRGKFELTGSGPLTHGWLHFEYSRDGGAYYEPFYTKFGVTGVWYSHEWTAVASGAYLWRVRLEFPFTGSDYYSTTFSTDWTATVNANWTEAEEQDAAWTEEQEQDASWTETTKATTAWTEDTKPTTAWSEGQKPTTAWSEGQKPTTAWTEGTKPTTAWSEADVTPTDWTAAQVAATAWTEATVGGDTWGEGQASAGGGWTAERIDV
jgi:hypothetical protein